jgi:hypothetical protein
MNSQENEKPSDDTYKEGLGEEKKNFFYENE